MIASALAAASMQPAIAHAQAARPAAEAARFRTFFGAFRTSVLAGDRNAVAGMTQFPFVDFRAGRHCAPSDKGCTVDPDTLTSPDRASFLRKYNRIFTPAVVAAIRASHIRGFRPGDDDGEAGGPIQRHEYLLDSEDVDVQRVFVPAGGTWKLARVPFYS